MKPHLTLEELIAHAKGDPLDPASREHLAACAACQAEARRWTTVADGARRQLAAGSAPPPPSDSVLAAIGTAPPRLRRLPRRRVVLASAAAAILIGGVAYASLQGADGRSPGDPGSPTPGMALAAGLTDTDCENLKVAIGTLESVSGAGIVLKSGRETITVTVPGTARITRDVSGGLSDIAAGAHVLVRGRGVSSGDKVTAEHVTVMPRGPEPPAPPPGAKDLAEGLARLGNVNGKVTGLQNGSFTVQVSRDKRVQVRTSPATKVIKQANVGLGQLKTGELTVAVGSAWNGGLAATTIQQSRPPFRVALPRPSLPPTALPSTEMPSTALPSTEMPPPPGQMTPPRPPDAPFKGLGCDSSRIARAAVLAANLQHASPGKP